ncbi:hypothetical protein [Psychroserpens damuponensis]|uniref:hypothetical protein n=1 Tax=Psychroserpens damuponensis TaxID=943936 RepID=UPI00058B5D2E|nr:hypothetical protein [Psychroserpens damuponensis]
MKFKVLFLLVLVCVSCKDATENTLDDLKSDRFELLPEPDNAEKETFYKHLRLTKFLENPIDLQEFKLKKGQSLSSVTNGLDYHFQPDIKDALFYRYGAFPFQNSKDKIAPIDIIVFKHGINKHNWNDTTELLIEFTVSGKDDDLKSANLVGLTTTELELQFGSDYQLSDNKMVYTMGNKALIIELQNSKVTWFKYIKLNTEDITNELIKQILTNTINHHNK